MSKKKELFKDTIILFFSKALTQFISIIMLPLYTSKLSTADYGIVEIVTNYIYLFMPLVTFQIEMAAFRFLINEKKEKNQNIIISNSIFMTILMIIVTIFVIAILNNFFKIDNFIYIILMFISITICNIFMQIVRGLNKTLDYAIGSIIIGTITVSCNFIFLNFLNYGIISMYLSIIIAYVLANIYFLFKCKLLKKISIKFLNFNNLSKLLVYSIPLVPNQIIWWIINSIDRTIIMLFLGASASGIYSVSHKIPTIYTNAYNIFNLAWSASLSKNIGSKDYDNYVSVTFNEVFILFATLALGIIAVVPFVFNVLINQNYQAAFLYIPLLMISSVFSVFVNLLTSMYIALKKTKKLALTAIYAGIINTAVNLILVKKIGIYAAPISTIISFGIMGVYRYIDIKKYIKLSINIKKILLIIISYIIIYILYFNENFILRIISLIISIIIFLIMNNNYIESLFKLLKRYYEVWNAKRKLKL